jgi:hypothetical protein
MLLTSTARDLDGPVRQLSPIIAIQKVMYFLERKTTSRGFLAIKTSSRNIEAFFFFKFSWNKMLSDRSYRQYKRKDRSFQRIQQIRERVIRKISLIINYHARRFHLSRGYFVFLWIKTCSTMRRSLMSTTAITPVIINLFRTKQLQAACSQFMKMLIGSFVISACYIMYPSILILLETGWKGFLLKHTIFNYMCTICLRSSNSRTTLEPVPCHITEKHNVG